MAFCYTILLLFVRGGAGLFRGCQSKLRSALPQTWARQQLRLSVAREYAAVLGRMTWNGKTRAAEGQTLVAQEEERARLRFSATVGAAPPPTIPEWVWDKFY